MDKKKVLVGMSGGVDSTAAAVILAKMGYDVSGATMRLYVDTDEEISQTQDEIDAKAVCDKLGIKHYVIDFQKEFRKNVIDYFVDEYIGGKTPNPCIACNKHLKFGLMFDSAKEMGFDYIATGHYAKIYEENGTYFLKMGDYKEKDQSYVLYNLTQEQLKHTLMPLGDYKKEDVRKICEELELPIANKPESMEICFVKNNDYVDFIRNYKTFDSPVGDIVDTKGNILGKHKGLINYTIGQRKGIGAYGRPMFVLKIDKEKNQLVLGEKGMEFSKSLTACDVNFLSGKPLKEPMYADVKVRYQARPAKALLKPIENEMVYVEFEEPQRAVTPGQAVVFYDGEILLGGGTVV